ncbi:hypothetical protein CF645_38580, partial [Burkholderia pseudomallei]
MHEYARRDEWLAKVSGQEWQDARLLARADMRADGRPAAGRPGGPRGTPDSAGHEVDAPPLRQRGAAQHDKA